MKSVIQYTHTLKRGALLITFKEGKLNKPNLETALKSIALVTGYIPDKIFARYMKTSWYKIGYENGFVGDIQNLFERDEEKVVGE